MPRVRLDSGPAGAGSPRRCSSPKRPLGVQKRNADAIVNAVFSLGAPPKRLLIAVPGGGIFRGFGKFAVAGGDGACGGLTRLLPAA